MFFSIPHLCSLMVRICLQFKACINASFALEIPRDAKTHIADLFQHVANININDLPRDMPGVNRRRIASLLPYVPDDTYVNNLVYAWRNASGDIIFGPSVQNNPWEWSESIEPSPSVLTSTYAREKPDLRNSSSIPLEVFGTQPTGERVFGEVPGEGREEGVGARAGVRVRVRAREAAAARQLEDGLAGDNVFERDWRETRVADLSASGEYGAEGSGGGQQQQYNNDGTGAGPGTAGTGEHIKQEGVHGQIPSASTSGSGGAVGGIGGGGGASPAPTVRSQRSSIASSSRTAQRASSTSSRGRSSGHGEGGEHSVADSSSGSTSRASTKRKTSNASLEFEPPTSSSSTRGGGKRGRGRGANTGRGKSKKK